MCLDNCKGVRMIPCRDTRAKHYTMRGKMREELIDHLYAIFPNNVCPRIVGVLPSIIGWRIKQAIFFDVRKFLEFFADGGNPRTAGGYEGEIFSPPSDEARIDLAFMDMLYKNGVLQKSATHDGITVKFFLKMSVISEVISSAAAVEGMLKCQHKGILRVAALSLSLSCIDSAENMYACESGNIIFRALKAGAGHGIVFRSQAAYGSHGQILDVVLAVQVDFPEVFIRVSRSGKKSKK